MPLNPIWKSCLFAAALLLGAAIAPARAGSIDCSGTSSQIAATRAGTNLTANVSVSSHTSWQPIGGEVHIVVEVPPGKDLPSDVDLGVCFRWATKKDPMEWQLSSRPLRSVQVTRNRIELAVTVPELEKDSNNPIQKTQLLIPMAEVRVVIRGLGAGSDVDVVRTFGVVSSGLGYSAGLATLAVLLFALSRLRGRSTSHQHPLLRVITTKTGRASLSQFQVLLWVCVIGYSVVYVMALSGDLIPIPEQMLGLLGISGLSVLGAQLPTPGAQGAASPAAKRDAPRWSDLVLSDDDIPDVTRVQMLFFTVITAFFVTIRVISSYEIPEIDNSYLALMGVTNGVYLLNKFTPAGKAASAAERPQPPNPAPAEGA
ncbi:MAG TPA: hypothetical protein VD978_10155 [Azospirillum sp.]|nr:hypothetical protein [Azospirillum sp.]